MSHSKLIQAACLGVLLFFVLPKFAKADEHCDADDCIIEDGEDELYIEPSNHENSASKTAQLTLRRRPLVIISTIDGDISAIDPEDGSLVWRQETGPGPMLSSSISQIELVSKGKSARLIPSLDGGLYKFDGQSVDAVPVTAESLLKSSFRLNEDLLITGGKESRIYGVSSISGRIQYVCGMDGCETFGEEASLSNEGLLVVKRSTQTVRAVEPRTGMERWNFSVGQHEINFLSDDDAELPCPTLALDPDLKIVVPDGMVYGFNRNYPNTFTWKQKFKSPVVHAWILNNGKLRQLDLLSPEFVPSLLPGDVNLEAPRPLLYVGLHKSMLYVQESISIKAQVLENISGIGDIRSDFPRVKWTPFLATAHTRTPAIAFEKSGLGTIEEDGCSNDSADSIETSVSTIFSGKLKQEYPYDTGVYLFESPLSKTKKASSSSSHPEIGVDFLEPRPGNTSYDSEDDGDNSYEYGGDYEDYTWYDGETVHFVPVRDFSYYWKEVVLSCVICTLVVHLVYTRGIERQMRFDFGRQFNRCVMVNVPIITAAFMQIERRRQARQTLQPQDENGNSTSCKKDDFKTSVTIDPPAPTGSSPSSPSLDSTLTRGSSTSSNEEYKSRYLTDFSTESCLGKGGFGIVFEAKNKVDECSYAVKRIRLPNRPEAREKVMREVKALAKLDHSHIVRYFNAWLEIPPAGWQESLGSSKIQHEVSDPAGYDESRTDLSVSQIFPVRQQFAVSKGPNPFRLDDISDAARDISIPIGSFSDESDYIQFEANGEDSRSLVKRIKDCCAVGAVSDSSDGYRHECCVQMSSSAKSDSGSEISSVDSTGGWGSEKNKNGALHPMHIENGLLRREELSDVSKATGEGPKLFLYIQMQLCQKDSLREWLRGHQGHRDSFQVLQMFNQILQAVEYVHMQGMIHRDLKPSNIFFSQDGQIKVGDFGLVTAMVEDEEAQTPNGSEALIEFNPLLRHTDRVGTQLYMSPEQIAGKPYNHKVDIYSLGLIFFELLCPFKTQMEQVRTLMNLKNFIFPSDFEQSHPQEMALLKMMLSHNPDERPTTIGIRARPPMVDNQEPSIHEFPEYMHFTLQRARSTTRTASSSSS